jgi:hypothetical protein
VQGISIPCYINNCASCPISPVICHNCTDLTNCCSAHCTSCAGLTCNACETGFALEFNLCIPDDACASISFACTNCSLGVCLSCLNGTYLMASLNMCWFCPEECLTCISPSNCTSCPSHAYLLNNFCQPCSSSCLNCLSSASNCSSCLTGATLYQSQCVPCQQNCDVCTASSPSTTACVNCSSGYYFSTATSTCESCPASCSVCTGPNSCQNCSEAGMYYSSSSNKCSQCVQGCSVCSGPATCSQCIFNYYISPVFGSGQCVSCLQSNCIECISSTECSICSPGSTLAAGICFQCDNGINNCLNCTFNVTTQNTNCTICQQNYFLEGNQCLPCPNYCLKCTSATFCTFCAVGFITNPQGGCQPAYPNCVYSPLATHCEACTPGSYYSNGLCLSCPPNCASCNNGPCSACQVGYFLSSGSTC